jgi:hypothetical protein
LDAGPVQSNAALITLDGSWLELTLTFDVFIYATLAP